MMHNKGFTKLTEECGELVQIIAKQTAYPDTDIHPDGKGSMKNRIEEEMADVMAAITFVIDKNKLDKNKIFERGQQKLTLFNKWDQQC